MRSRGRLSVGFMQSRSVEQHLGSSEDNDSNDLSAYVALDYAQNP